jgi:predicted dienelactone hydrolase
MLRFLAALALAAALPAAALAQPTPKPAVGFQHFDIPDPAGGAPIEVGVWYPAQPAPGAATADVNGDAVVPGAPVKGARLPLVVMSHGNGGEFAGHHDTALALAEAGFVAAALTHKGDNYRDTSQAVAIWERPRQLKVLIDYMLADWAQHGDLDPERVGAFGFSAGGFTVLAAAGGEADLQKVVPHCQAHPDFYDCKLVAKAHLTVMPKVAWTHDARIKAVVAAAPAIGFTFGREGLANLHQPVQLWRAADDQVLPHPYYAEAVREALPTPPETHVVDKAGHYDFLSPCSADLARRYAEICVSEPGFDRPAFHAQFDKAVVAFFERTLPPQTRAAN